jgi:hypothetical protein
MPRWIIAEGEELGQEPPGAAIWQPSPHLRQCPLVFGGAAVWHEFRCRAKCRPRRDRTSARFEPRRRHLDRAEQRAQPPGARVLQRAQAQAVRAVAAQCAVLRNPGLNQVPLHAPPAGSCRRPASGRADRGANRGRCRHLGQLRRSASSHQRRSARSSPAIPSPPPVFQASKLAPPCLGRSQRCSSDNRRYALYFHGMVAKTKAGELNLSRTIWGLRAATAPKADRGTGRAAGLRPKERNTGADVTLSARRITRLPAWISPPAIYRRRSYM